MQCHPIFASCRCSSLSRSLLRLIFFSQKSVFVLGIRKYLQPSCPCQKHPFTNTHVRYLRNTISGWPGSRGLLSRYRNPCRHRYLRTSISGFVFAERIEAIFLCRCCVVSTSMIAKIQMFLQTHAWKTNFQGLEARAIAVYEKVLPKSPIGKAMHYLLAHKASIKVYAGWQIPHSRRKLNPHCRRRKKGLPVLCNHRAAGDSVIYYTMMGCCKLVNADPKKWMLYFLNHIHEHDCKNSGDIADFLPQNLTEKGLV